MQINLERMEIDRPQFVGGFFMSIIQHMITYSGVYPRPNVVMA